MCIHHLELPHFTAMVPAGFQPGGGAGEQIRARSGGFVGGGRAGAGKFEAHDYLSGFGPKTGERVTLFGGDCPANVAGNVRLDQARIDAMPSDLAAWLMKGE